MSHTWQYIQFNRELISFEELCKQLRVLYSGGIVPIADHDQDWNLLCGGVGSVIVPGG